MPLDMTALRQALEAGDLKHADVEALINQVEEQAGEIVELERKLGLAQTWVRSHYGARQQAEKALLNSVRRTVRDSARLAKRWPRHELANVIPRGKKPTNDQMYIARLTANGIQQHILNQIEKHKS